MRFALLALVLAGALFLWMRASASAPESSEAAPAAASGPLSLPEEIRRIGAEVYAGDCPQYGRAPRQRLEAELADADLPRGKRLPLMLDLAREYVEANEVPRAIALLEEAMELSRQTENPKKQRRVMRDLALAWLREAENQNCVERHNADCCIFPPREGGLHAVRKPAEQARKLYRALLADDPEDLAVRWLVNVTSVLLGDSPADGLPEDERIPAPIFGAPAAEPWFRDVATRAGVDSYNLAGGVAVEDFDGDGLFDILTSTCDPLGPLHYFRNTGDGTFADLSAATGAATALGGLNLISADYDEDGDQDALVLRGAWLVDHGAIPDSLLRNDAGKAFVDVTREAGLDGPPAPSQAGVFGDFDGDGSLDLYIGNESRVEVEEVKGKGDHPSQLFKNDGTGEFTDVAAEAGVRNDRYAKGVAAGDYDDDGDLDLYVSNIGENRLYENDGRARFEDVAPAAGVLEPSGRSFACWFVDYDQDGRLDLWVNGYEASLADLAADALGQPHEGALSCMYRNRGDGRFDDATEELGLDHPWLAMGANFGDVDGDGWLDMYLGTGDPFFESLMPNVLLRNVEGKRFDDETVASGLGHLQKGHGVGFCDFDGDGDQDLFHQLGGFFPADAFRNTLFENRMPAERHGRHWLRLSLTGTRTNRDAVGARVEVHLATPAGPRVLHRAAGSVSSFGGNPHRLELGLGDATRIERIVIRWPRTSEPQVFAEVPLDTWLAIREGDSAYETRTVRKFRF